MLILNRAFTDIDRMVESHGLERIKTTGRSYMVVCGVPAPQPDHAQALARPHYARRRDKPSRLTQKLRVARYKAWFGRCSASPTSFLKADDFNRSRSLSPSAARLRRCSAISSADADLGP